MDELSLPPLPGYEREGQRQYQLTLRGNSLNPMIDAATPLLGMVMRVSGMNSHAMPEHLFTQVVTDVQAVIWTETGATSTEWKTKPMQIGKIGDNGILKVTVPARPRKYKIITPKNWDKYLKNKSDMIKNNPEYNIRAGIFLLMIKMSETEKDKTVYDNEKEDIYEVVKGDLGYSSIAKKIGTTQNVLTTLNGVKVIHPGDKLKYKKAHLEQYIQGWKLFTPKNIQIQYNGDPKRATVSKPGDINYADKFKYVYSLIVSDENKKQIIYLRTANENK